MLTKYFQAAMRHAEYKILDDGTFFGEIPDFEGLWANAKTLEACREELLETLEDWTVRGIRLGHDFPVVDGIELTIPQAV